METAQLPPPSSRPKKIAFTAAAITMGVGVSLITAELILRAIGIPP
jgi:hypothetical protein